MRAEVPLPKGKLSPELLQTLLERYAGHDPRLVAGPGVGEDVAVIDMGDRYMVIKTDPITFATDQIGWYAVNVNANDVATSGARPLWMLCTLLLPEGRATLGLVETIMAQLHEACAELGIVLVGGHTEVTWGLDRPIAVGVMIGEVPRGQLLTTAGARAGDRILLVKGIPIEATAIIAREKAPLLRARGYDEAFVARAQRYLYDPGISVVSAARIAATHPGVHAMHDPTEGGLATGLYEMAVAAGTGALLDEGCVEVLPEAARLCAEFGLNPLGAIASGALLVAIDPTQAADLIAAYARENVSCRDIGALLDDPEEKVLLRHGRRLPLPRFDADEIARLF